MAASDDDSDGAVALVMSNSVQDARVVGVMQLERYKACFKCKSKLIPDNEDPDLGHCQKCDMMQCVDSCTDGLNAQVMVEGDGK